MASDYDPLDAVTKMAMEHSKREINDGRSAAEFARSLLAESVATAVMSVTHLSQHAMNERIQLDACKYIIDKVLGKDSHLWNVAGDPLDAMLEELLSQDAG